MNQPSKDIVKFILERNEMQSAEFCTPGAQLERRLYRAQHPSEIIALKCMDGRLNLALMTKTPPGIIKPYRNIGGKFNLGWPFFGRLILEDIEYAVAKGRPTIVLSTYHFSKGDTRRGCAGHNYDTAAAREGALKLKDQFNTAFGKGNMAVFPIVVGIETDEGGLVFQGENGNIFDIAVNSAIRPEEINTQLRKLYPGMPEQITNDLIPLIIGNQKYVREVISEKRPVQDLEHKEQIIAVGRGFDWLHLPNRALIIGPFDPHWEDAVVVAGNIVMGNIKAGRVAENEDILLLVCAPYRSVGADQGVAIEKVKFLAAESEKALRDRVPGIGEKLKILAGTVDLNTRQMHTISKSFNHGPAMASKVREGLGVTIHNK